MMEQTQGFSSQVTFLNFHDFDKAKHFLSQVLELPAAYDTGWAVVYAIPGGGFLGAVDHSRSHVSSGQGEGVLISLTTCEMEAWHRKIGAVLEVSPIREIPDAGLKSFFFTGPEGYHFEIQQFVLPEAIELFGGRLP